MKQVEKTYEDLKFQIPFLDFKQSIKQNEEGMNWQNFAEDFIFEPSNPFIRKCIRTVHTAKTNSEKEFKQKIDQFILKAHEQSLLALGLTIQFLEKLKRYIMLMYTDRETQKNDYMATFTYIQKSENYSIDSLKNKLKELEKHFESQIIRTPLLFIRTKSEK